MLAQREDDEQQTAALTRSTVGPLAGGGTITPGDSIPFGSVAAMPWDGWPDEWGTWWGYGATDPDGYLHRVSTVMTCVDLNSRQLGSFPVYGVLRKTGELFELPTWSRNPEPNLYSSWDEFVKASINSLQLHGEIVLWATARDAAGFPARFVALSPQVVEIEPDGRGGKRFRLAGGVELDPNDVLHVPYQTLPMRLRGIGPLEWSTRSLVSAAALERYAADIAEHGVWAVLRHPSNLSRQQADDAKSNWRQARAATPGDPAVLSGGFEFDVLSLNPKDMALLDLRTFDEQRIAAAFGIPPFLIGLPNPGGMTYSNTTQLFEFHWKATLRPMAQLFARALSAWTMPAGRLLEFNRDEYVRPGLEERARAYQTLHGVVDDDGSRAIYADEVRAAERFEPRAAPADVTPPSETPIVEG